MVILCTNFEYFTPLFLYPTWMSEQVVCICPVTISAKTLPAVWTRCAGLIYAHNSPIYSGYCVDIVW